MKLSTAVFALLIIISASSMSQETMSHKHPMDSTKVRKPMMHKHHVDSTKAVTYTCPMHPDVISDKPGKCPKCKMNLVKVDAKKGNGASKITKETKAEVYTCPMHPDVKSDKPGKCPKCKMNLVKENEIK